MNHARGFIAVVCLAVACGLSPSADPAAGDPKKLPLAILHMNDVYEITPLNRGTVGGLARVATLKKQLAKEYGGRLLTVHCGDFLSPSALGTAVVDGKQLAGEQMVDVLKAVGVDYIIFGNHEFDSDKKTFDLRLDELRVLRDLPDFGFALSPEAVERANEQRRALFSTNVTQNDKGKTPFPKVPLNRVWEPYHTQEDGKLIRLGRIGFIGLTLDTPKSDPAKQYAAFKPPIDAARAQFDAWQAAGEKFNAVVAMTHQSLDGDEALARAELRGNLFPGPAPELGLGLILGGHEHVNTHRRAVPAKPGGLPLPPIYRADANARTVYLHKLFFDDGRLTRIESTLIAVTDAMPEDPVVAAVVQKWVDKAYRAFRADGRDPEEELTTLSEAYDGREESIRNGPTNLTDLIGDAMLAPLTGTAADARLAIYNSGAIRIDDELQPGPLTTYDVLRVLPFGGVISAVEVSGDIVAKMLDHTISKDGHDPGQNTGAFLQTRNVTRKEGEWKIGGATLDPKKTYTVAINDYLLLGNQKLENTGKVVFAAELSGLGKAKRTPLGDWRDLLRDSLRKMKGGRPAGGSVLSTTSNAVRKDGKDGKDGTDGKDGRDGKDGSEKTREDSKSSWEASQVLLGIVVIILLLAVLIVFFHRLFFVREEDIARNEFKTIAWGLLAEVESLLRGKPMRDSSEWNPITQAIQANGDTVRTAWALLQNAAPPASASLPPTSANLPQLEDKRVMDAYDRLTRLYALLVASRFTVEPDMALRFARAAAVLDLALKG